VETWVVREARRNSDSSGRTWFVDEYSDPIPKMNRVGDVEVGTPKDSMSGRSEVQHRRSTFGHQLAR
jgi:hypothetical protein